MLAEIDQPEFDLDGPQIREPVDMLDAVGVALTEIERYSKFRFDGERWPRLRQGERIKITGLKRRLIVERDGYACRSCGKHLLYSEVEIDHIIPWSAHGSDWSCNLRVLCGPCNADRSNYRSGLDHDRRPFVATECYGCGPWEPYDEMINAYCARCGLVGPTWPELVM